MLLDGSIDSRESFQAVLERICKLACCAVSSARSSPAFCVGSTLAYFQKPDIAAVSVASVIVFLDQSPAAYFPLREKMQEQPLQQSRAFWPRADHE